MMSACRPSTQDLTPIAADPIETEMSEVLTTTSQPSLTPTTFTPNTLTICTASLPEDLFLYNHSNAISKANLLSLMYEEAFILVDGDLRPGILEKVPSRADGDLVLMSVPVEGGQSVVDANGQVKILKSGIQIRPSGCRGGDCAITWDGETPLEMDQMVVDYKIREGLTWSDGLPVIAEDSVLSFEIVTDLSESSLNWATTRTESYEVINQKEVQWRGLPGFTTADLSSFFWKPLPAHYYQDVALQEIFESDEWINTSQVSYGPFSVSNWEDGVLLFSRNPHYFRAVEGLPELDLIKVRQVDGGVSDAWSDLQNGDCDVLDSSFNLIESPELLVGIQSNPEFDLLVETSESWIQLVFGINPASHDDFYNPELGDRPDYLGDPRTRQAMMHCLDRDSLNESALGGFGEVWPSYLKVEDSMLEPGEALNYDPARGLELLQSVGWYDLDGNPSTPLQSWYVPNVPEGGSLSLDLLISSNPFHQAVAEAIQADLGECGVGVTVKTLPVESLYAPGPDGLLFGRQFDLALISWQPMPGGDCQLYQSWAQPSDENYWIGTNIAGLLNEGYDNACANAALALPGEKEEAVRQSELVYLRELPAVPLISIPRVMVIPGDGCFSREISTESEFYADITHFGIGAMCP